MQDPFLKSLNAIVNGHKVTFGITLVVAGGVITGTLVSANSYIEAFANSFSEAFPGGPNENVRAGFAAWGQPGAEKIHDEFIHLKDARYISGATLIPTNGEGVLWRGSLDSVSGFSLGAPNPN
ncbi:MULTISPECIES: hypothetical protein [unclassified Pseudomonas]|jgi:uncharacterized protein YejL (UPF0352 family)|uniref:hypothetical protein n=1 Tax=unclassified Pseudomonas TaxID=196821 RepID=UPI001CBC6D7F|nr:MULTISPECIES: hypothetical protein [unclassified Pseudomonas]